MKKKETSATFGVIGLGRFGSALVECLSKAEKEVIAVDRDESRVREARRFTDFAMVVSSLDQESLEEIGIGDTFGAVDFDAIVHTTRFCPTGLREAGDSAAVGCFIFEDDDGIIFALRNSLVIDGGKGSIDALDTATFS